MEKKTSARESREGSGGSGLSREAAAYLASSGRAFLVTLRGDGSPTAHPMTAVVADGRLVYNTYRKSVKVRNVARDPRTCSLLLPGYEPIARWALVYKGRAAEVDAAQVDLARTEASQPAGLASSTVERASTRLEQGKRLLLAIDPEESLVLEDGGA